MQDWLREAGHVLREPGVAVQRVAVAGQPVDERLVLPRGQCDLRVGLPLGDLRRGGPLPRLATETALAADDRGRESLGDLLARAGGGIRRLGATDDACA